MKQVVILGATGSIGASTLSVIEHNPNDYQVLALVAGFNAEKMAELCLKFKPKIAAMFSEKAAIELKERLAGKMTLEIRHGLEAICEIAAHNDADMVMAAIVGAAGLAPTLSAIKAGKRVLLANKESLVTCGQLFIDEVEKSGAELLPVDSEHNAIFQSLPEKEQRRIGQCNLNEAGIKHILLTGSGGPFRERELSTFGEITPAQAVAHPNWSMGQKISVDSATMMNKGLEYIEARWLFSASEEQMQIIIHPQSIIHSMVRYVDGSVIAQMGNPDMRTPIAETMSYPYRTFAGVDDLDFFKLSQLTFIEPDFARYPCLKLAIDSFREGQYATTAMNAANEIAVESFLNNQIKFTDIAELSRKVVESINPININTIEDVFAVDKLAREIAFKSI